MTCAEKQNVHNTGRPPSLGRCGCPCCQGVCECTDKLVPRDQAAPAAASLAAELAELGDAIGQHMARAAERIEAAAARIEAATAAKGKRADGG